MAQAASTYLGEQRRRSTRLEQTSPLIIRGVDLLGQPFEERTATQNLSFQGCRYASKHHLPKNTWVTLEAPSGDLHNEVVCVRARVAWIQRPRTLRELFQVGVELERPKNIWNVAFPPGDWTSDRPAALSIVCASDPVRHPNSHSELSLEDYLRLAVTVTDPETSIHAEGAQYKAADDTLIEQIRREFLRQSEKMIVEARAETDELINQKASALRTDLENSQQASAKAFHEQWLQAFQREQVNTRQEIEVAISGDVSAQLARFRDEVKDSLATEWVQHLSQARVEWSKWQSDGQAFKDEIRAHAEALFNQAGERVEERLAEIRHQLERSLAANDSAEASTDSAKQSIGGSQAALSSDLESARQEWNELLESSIDSAARRFTERISSSSREILRSSDRGMASRAAELQKEVGIATEASRAALEEMKKALRLELSAAQSALIQMEQSASAYSRYSQQLDSAGRDALNDFRGRLDSAIANKFAAMEERTAEVEAKVSERANVMFDERVREMLHQNRQEIEAAATAALERVKAATEDIDARDEDIENMMEIHRERLRQLAEHIQREQASRLSSDLALFHNNLDEKQGEALEQWSKELQAASERARQDAFIAISDQIKRQFNEADARLAASTNEAIESALCQTHSEMHHSAEQFKIEMNRIESDRLARVAERLASAAQEQLESARAQFKAVAETAASALGEMIAEANAKALTAFSAVLEERVEHARTRFVFAADDVLHSVQAHAQTSFEHFQEQLAIKSEQAVQKATEALDRAFDGKIDYFRGEAEAALVEWRARQESLAAQALATNQQDLKAAAGCTIEAALEHLKERITATEGETENAVRQGCVNVLETMAQRIRERSQRVEENRGESSIGDLGPAERHASA